MNVTDPIRRRAQLAPDAPAFMRPDGTTATYAMLDGSVDAVAHRIREIGLVPGQNAVLVTRDYYKYLVTALALARAGVAVAPVTLPTHFTDVALLDEGEQGNGCPRIVSLNDLSPVRAAGGPVPPFESHSDGAAIFAHYPSSGTTGKPKLTPVSHELSLRRSDARALGLTRLPGGRGAGGARQACHISLIASYGFSSALITLYDGGTVLEAPTEPAQVPRWLVESRITYLVTSPASLARMVELLPAVRHPNSLATVEVGGGALPPKVLAMTRERLCSTVIVSYGLTEAGRVAWGPAGRSPQMADTGGFPYPGVTIEVVDDHDRPVPPGKEGNIRIRSEKNASGYLDDPKASAAVFRNGWVYPGDFGVFDPDGWLRIIGRADDIINRGGHKINPQAVDDTVMTLGDLKEAAVFGFNDRSGLARVCIAIVTGDAFDGEAFEARCKQELGMAAPDFIMEVRALPRNANGKVLRQELARAALRLSEGASPAS